MIGVSSLNMNNPFVLVMEKEYVATRKALVAYTRKSITVMVILSIIDIIAGIFTGNYFLYSFMLISSDIFLWITLKNTIRDTNLKKVNEEYTKENSNLSSQVKTLSLDLEQTKKRNAILEKTNVDKIKELEEELKKRQKEEIAWN